jgi:chaperonin GroES
VRYRDRVPTSTTKNGASEAEPVEKAPAKAPEEAKNAHEKPHEKGNDKGHDKGHDKSNDKGHDKSSDKAHEKAHDKPQERAPEKPRERAQDKQPITVLFDRVMVQISQADGERRSRAGILIPATAQLTRRLTWAEAVAVGPHVRTIKVGDTVLFNPEDRFEVEVHGEEYVILRERDIHAIASSRNDSGTGLYL